MFFGQAKIITMDTFMWQLDFLNPDSNGWKCLEKICCPDPHTVTTSELMKYAKYLIQRFYKEIRVNKRTGSLSKALASSMLFSDSTELTRLILTLDENAVNDINNQGCAPLHIMVAQYGFECYDRPGSKLLLKGGPIYIL